MRMKINANLPCLSALLAAALLLSGCASQQYMGVSLKPGGADPAVQALAARASIGDKQAQYELGRWFEDSTDADGLKKAIKLYHIAATPRGGSRMMYTPGSSGVTTSVVSMGQEIEPYGLAKERLAVLQNFNFDRARYIRLANAGFGQIVADRFSEISSESLGFYPRGDDECAYSSRISLKYMIKRYVYGSGLALPLACISRKRVKELVELADQGNWSAQFTLATLALEIEGPGFDYSWQVIRRLSDEGYGPASIVLGGYLFDLGDRKGAVEKFELANSQGISNAELYIRRAIQPLPRELDK